MKILLIFRFLDTFLVIIKKSYIIKKLLILFFNLFDDIGPKFVVASLFPLFADVFVELQQEVFFTLIRKDDSLLVLSQSGSLSHLGLFVRSVLFSDCGKGLSIDFRFWIVKLIRVRKNMFCTCVQIVQNWHVIFHSNL